MFVHRTNLRLQFTLPPYSMSSQLHCVGDWGEPSSMRSGLERDLQVGDRACFY